MLWDSCRKYNHDLQQTQKWLVHSLRFRKTMYCWKTRGLFGSLNSTSGKCPKQLLLWPFKWAGLGFPSLSPHLHNGPSHPSRNGAKLFRENLPYQRAFLEFLQWDEARTEYVIAYKLQVQNCGTSWSYYISHNSHGSCQISNNEGKQLTRVTCIEGCTTILIYERNKINLYGKVSSICYL